MGRLIRSHCSQKYLLAETCSLPTVSAKAAAALNLDLAPATEDRARPKFPSSGYRHAAAFGLDYLAELAAAAATLDPFQVDRAAAILTDAYDRGATLFAAGNGGSAAVANHLQCDHMKGVRTGTDLTPRVISLATNVELITAVANDIGYDEVFTYQLQSQASSGDVLLVVSSSGSSPNVVRALEWARLNGLRTIALTGFSGGGARALAEASLHVDSTNYGVVEDLHQAVMHFLAQFVRQSRMDGATVAATIF